MKSSINPARISNASRVYNSGKAAAAAIGISQVHYHRLCKEYGIETPAQRRQREKVESRRYREEVRAIKHYLRTYDKRALAEQGLDVGDIDELQREELS